MRYVRLSWATGRSVAVCFLLLHLSLLSRAQSSTPTTQLVKGTVVDQESEQPIVAANVVIVGTEPLLGAGTDIDGHFRIPQVPLGRHTLHITCLGYEEAVLHEIEVGAGKEVILNVRLTEALFKIETVVVSADRLNGTPNNEMASVSARSFSVDQTKRYAAAVNDPARMALSFAGVSSTDDGGNEIVIRGNSPRSVLWRMEGIEIPNPNHFGEQGASGGGVSALSVNVLANSDFLTSAFPAEYGNAYSGVFDLKLRNGNNETREYAAQAGVLGLDFAAEGPIGEKGGASYLANYRYSTLGVLSLLNLGFTEDTETIFQDAAFKVNVPTAKNGYLSLWGIGGLSNQLFKEENSTYDYYSDRGVLGLNRRLYLNETTYLEAILSYSTERQGDDFNENDPEEGNILYQSSFRTNALRLSLLYNRKISARHTLRAGVVGHRLDYRLYERFADADEDNTFVDETGETYFAQAYAQWKYRIGANLHANLGLHANWLAIAGQYAVEPRFGLRWNFRPGQSLSAGVGWHSRLDPLPVYFARVEAADANITQPNKELPLSKAVHLVLGYDWRFAPGWRLQTEAYYQHLYDIPIGTVHTTDDFLLHQAWLNADGGFVADSLAADGTGRNYGVEITLEKFLTDGWYVLSTTSLYRSLYTARDGVERSSRFDGRFVQNLLVGKEWELNGRRPRTLGANLRLIWAGGNRYTPIDLEESRADDSTNRDWSRAYESQMPNYFRADIRVSYRWNRPKSTSTLSLDIQNTTNRQNLYDYYYDSDTDRIDSYTHLGLLPVLNYRVEF